MNIDDIDKMIAALEAFKKDGKVQFRLTNITDAIWTTSTNPRFNFSNYDYRPCPPEPREFWVNLYESKQRGVAYASKQEADLIASSDRLECVKVREVLK